MKSNFQINSKQREGVSSDVIKWAGDIEQAYQGNTEIRSSTNHIIYILKPHDAGGIKVETYRGNYLKTKGKFSKLRRYDQPYQRIKKEGYVTDIDWDIIRRYHHQHLGDEYEINPFFDADDAYSWWTVPLVGKNGYGILYDILNTGRCFWQEPLISRKFKMGAERKGRFKWQILTDGRQSIKCIVDADGNIPIIVCSPPCYLDLQSMECGIVNTGIPENLQDTLLKAPKVTLKEAEYLNNIVKKEYGINIPLPKRNFKTQISNDYTPTPVLNLHPISITVQNLSQRNRAISSIFDMFSNSYQVQTVGCQVGFKYGDMTIGLNSPKTSFFQSDGDRLIEIKRNKGFEKSVIKKLRKLSVVSVNYNKALRSGTTGDGTDHVLVHSDFNPANPESVKRDNDFWEDFIRIEVKALRNKGYEVILHPDLPYEDSIFEIRDDTQWYSDLEENDSGIDWFDMDVGVQVDGKNISMIPIMMNMLKKINNGEISESELKADRRGQIYVEMPGQGKVAMPFARFQKMYTFMKDMHSYTSSGANDKLKLHKSEAGSVVGFESTLGDNLQQRGNSIIRELSNKLSTFKHDYKRKSLKLPKGLNADLREYQKEGVNWLQSISEFKLGGVLADDMGLGKTVQALTHILLEKEQGRLDNPVLIVCPTSVVYNWILESEKFTPNLKVLKLHGSDRSENFNAISDYDIIITSYALILRDFEHLSELHYRMIILDEAQYIKNHLAKTTQKILNLNADTKLCLTGTPLENNLLELWSLFNFALPGYLGNKNLFGRFYKKPIEKEKDISRNKGLINRISPFMIRRSKDKVAKELPEKTEIIKYVELTKEQRDLYETIRVSMSDKVRQMISSQGFDKSYIQFLDALLKLRQICCHPQLLKSESAKSITQSAKLEKLMEMLEEMIAEGRSILLFSQFTTMLELIEKKCDAQGIEYVKIIGSTKDRVKPIDEFNAGKVNLFLISLKAGGTGLNLTKADTVIHYDPWWNPAVESQATDRAYRIGQDKPVFVYKLIVEKTIEEKILDLQNKKRELLDNLLDPMQQKGRKFDVKDVEMLLSEE